MMYILMLGFCGYVRWYDQMKGITCVWQSHVEIKHSIAYFDRITMFVATDLAQNFC